MSHGRRSGHLRAMVARVWAWLARSRRDPALTETEEEYDRRVW